MLKKTSNIENLTKEDDKKKRQKIQWDEVTIAEHDKERGSRQKIDEAPTPYRYLSESDQSEAEYSSDGEHLARCKAGNSVADSWETLHAKLQYEKHLQDNALTNSRLEQLETSYDYSSTNDTGTGDEMSVGTSDPSTTEFGEVISDKKPSIEKKLPIRPAIKNTSNTSNTNSNGPVTSPKPTKPRTTSSEKPRKSVLIKANDPNSSSSGGGNNIATHHNYHHNSNNTTNTTTFSNSSNYWGSSNAFSSSASPNTLPGGGSSSNNNSHNNNQNNNSSNSSHNHYNNNIVNNSNNNHNHQLFAGINNGSIDGDEEEGNEEGEGETIQQRELFKRKRAGHYNEFKVLQAMRAKMHDEDDDDDDDYIESMNNKPSYPALVRQRSLEKVTNVQPTPIPHAVIPNTTTSQASLPQTLLPPPPLAVTASHLPPAPPKSVSLMEVVDAVPMEEN